MYVSGSQFKILPNVLDDNATAQASFDDSLLETGWGVLKINAGFGDHTKDVDMMTGAGLLEGYLTAKYVNMGVEM